MSKLINVIIFTLITVLLLKFTGVVDGSSVFLGELDLLNPQNFKGTAFWTTLLGLGALMVATGGAAILTGASADLVMLVTLGAGFFITVVNMIGSLVILANQLSSISPILSALAISPILLIGLFGIIEFYVGRQ